MSKKIGFVLNAPVNFSETFLLQEFDLLKKAGYEVIIFEGYNSGQEHCHYKSIRSLPVKFQNLYDLFHIFRILHSLILFGLPSLVRLIKMELNSGTSFIRTLKRVWFNAHILTQKVDFLHFCFADVAIQKELTAGAIKAKMSVSLRGSDILSYGFRHKGCYDRLWKYSDKIHAVSEFILIKAKELGLSQKKYSIVIPDGILPSQIGFNSNDIHSPLRILNIGRLEPVKDHLLSLEVIRHLLNQNILLTYSIIGDGSLKNELIKNIERLKLKSYVEIKGRLEHSQILKFLPSFDLLLHTSQYEGLGVSLLEAQAAGLLTVALDAGGTNECLEDEKSGWIVKSRDPETISKKIIEIISLAYEEKKKIKIYSRMRVEEKFNLEILLSKWSDFFQK